MQVQKDPMPKLAVRLHQAPFAESVGGAFGERMQVHSSPVPMVLKESTQQRSKQTAAVLVAVRA